MGPPLSSLNLAQKREERADNDSPQPSGILATREASPGLWKTKEGQPIQWGGEGGDREGFLEEAMSQLRPDDKRELTRWRSGAGEDVAACPENVSAVGKGRRGPALEPWRSSQTLALPHPGCSGGTSCTSHSSLVALTSVQGETRKLGPAFLAADDIINLYMG